MKKASLASINFLILLGFSSYCFGNLDKFEEVKNNIFWQEFYNQDYHTLYCAIQKKAGDKTEIAQAYPAAWIANAMRCSSESNCDFARYRDAVSDLHNLWPMVPQAEDIRRHYIYIEGDKSEGKTKDCNIVVYPKGIEPRDWAKGEISRSLLYVIWKYNLPDYEQLPVLLKWHKKYPVNAEERWRNEKVKSIQGNDNPFISQKGFETKAFPTLTN